MQADVLIIQDLSCVGQVSMSVALPLLATANLRPDVLPTALLSTHTGGFGENTYLDLSSEMSHILQHWQKLQLRFSAVYLPLNLESRSLRGALICASEPHNSCQNRGKVYHGRPLLDQLKKAFQVS